MVADCGTAREIELVKRTLVALEGRIESSVQHAADEGRSSVWIHSLGEEEALLVQHVALRLYPSAQVDFHEPNKHGSIPVVICWGRMCVESLT